MRLYPAAALLLVLASGCENALTAPGIGGSVQTTEALAILPTDADVIGMMNLAAARQSDALAAVTGGAGLEMLSPGGSAEFDAFVRQTGFDPGRDLDRVYLAAPAMGSENGRAAFVGYGRFSRERVERFVATQTEHPVTTADVAGVTLYITTDSLGHTAGVAFPNDEMVVAGDEATVRQMLARIGTAGTTPSADVQDLLDRVAFPDGAWFVARHLDAGGAAGSPAGSAMRLAEGVAVSMDFGRDGVPVRAFIRTPQPDDLADLLRGSVSAARVGASDTPATVRALDDVAVATVADGVTVEAFLPTALLAEMHASGQR